MAVNVTGAVRLPNNTLFASAQVIIRRSGGVVAQSSAVMLPEEWVVDTDVSGEVDFSIEPGAYTAFADTNLGRIQWAFNVSETPSAQEFMDCVEAAAPTLTPALVEQAQDAADAAVAAAAASAGVQAFGALGDGTTNDQTAFNNALAATTGPVYVPWTSSFYVLSTLTEANRSRLYGPGEVRVAGTKVFIGSEPQVRDTDGIVRAFDADFQPAKWSSVDGSLYNGAFAANLTRTGGFGTYGASLINLTVTDATPSPEFDVVTTAWITHRNLTGGAAFAGWWGAVGPSPALGHTFTSGAVNGGEINIGAREMTALKVQPDGAKDYTGLKIVPDVAPSEDGPAFETVSNITIASPGVITRNAHGYYNGLRLRIYARTGVLPGGFTDGAQYYVVNATTNDFQLSATFGGTAINTTGSFSAGVAVLPSYPSHFGLNINRSIWWHKFWTGIVIGADTIVPGGIGIRLRGGSTAAQQPGNGVFMDGYHTNGVNVGGFATNAFAATATATNGFNFAVGTFSGAAILMASAQVVSWGAVTMAGTSGNLAINTTTGGVTIPRLTTTQRDAVGSWTDGTVIYNTTVPAFQGRQGGAWVNL